MLELNFVDSEAEGMNEGTPQQSMTVSAQRAPTFSGRGEGGAPTTVRGGAWRRSCEKRIERGLRKELAEAQSNEKRFRGPDY